MSLVETKGRRFIFIKDAWREMNASVFAATLALKYYSIKAAIQTFVPYSRIKKKEKQWPFNEAAL